MEFLMIRTNFNDIYDSVYCTYYRDDFFVREQKSIDIDLSWDECYGIRTTLSVDLNGYRTHFKGIVTLFFGDKQYPCILFPNNSELEFLKDELSTSRKGYVVYKDKMMDATKIKHPKEHQYENDVKTISPPLIDPYQYVPLEYLLSDIHTDGKELYEIKLFGSPKEPISGITQSIIDKIPDEFKEGYFLIEERRTQKLTVTKYPTLGKLNFNKVMDVHRIAQEVNMMRSCDNTIIPEVEDKYKIEQHGFDKYSFKKRK